MIVTLACGFLGLAHVLVFAKGQQLALYNPFNPFSMTFQELLKGQNALAHFTSLSKFWSH